MTNTPLCIQAALTAGLLALAPLSALANPITEDFGAYTPGNSVKAGQTNFGATTDGWLSPWRATVGNAVTVATIADDKPLNSGGNYFSTVVTTTAGKTLAEGTGGSLARAYEANTVSASGTTPFSIRFDFRADQAPAHIRLNLSDAGRRGAYYDSTATWVLSAHDGRWHAGDRFASTDTGLTFRAGVTYRVTITVNPAALTWDLSISGDDGSARLEHLAFRAKAWATDSTTPGARWLTFSASENIPDGTVSAGDTSAIFSVDTIAIGDL